LRDGKSTDGRTLSEKASQVKRGVPYDCVQIQAAQEAFLKGILKWPLVIAAVVLVLRVINERAGGPPLLSSALSVVVLHTLLAPIYFAIRIAGSSAERPYKALLKLILTYVVWTRAMLIPVYWLARIFEWPEPRFYGLWGADVNAFVGFIGVPFVTALFWIVISVVVGGAIGAGVLAMMRPGDRGQTTRTPNS